MSNLILLDNTGLAAVSVMAFLYILSLFLTALTSNPPRVYSRLRKR